MRQKLGSTAAALGTMLCCAVALAGPAPATDAPAQGPPVSETVVVDGDSGGRVFDGAGAVSAGASSRLLHDYPEPQRSEILDYLFSPGYGAALQILKVEIGADTNSTSGAEPSHMPTREQVDCDRGYQWWLMREAVERNPDIKLAGLQWGAPGWFEGGFWSQDNIDYLLTWLDCAEQHGLEIDYMGGWNESGYDEDWYVRWAAALEEHHPGIEVLAADDHPHAGWRVADSMAENPQFNDAVDILSPHSPCGGRTEYRDCPSTETARDLGKPLWIGELSSMAHDAGAAPLARALNRMYIDGRMTGLMTWSPISAWYANLPLADTGLMVAEWPWSGFYDVGSSIWSFAHTTQFVEPGWRYLDTGSRRLESGASIVSLASPSGQDWSAVVEAMDVTEPTTIALRPQDLPAGDLHLWRSDVAADGGETFADVGTLTPVDGEIRLTLEPGHLYSLTTTSGQGRGAGVPGGTVHERMDMAFTEDFEDVRHGGLARYFSDLSGGFQAEPCGAGRAGTCYRQIVSQAPINWGLVGDVPLSTAFGDPRWWGDYAVSADVLLEESDDGGYVELGGRLSGQSWGTAASGYHLRVGTDGWALVSRDHATRLETELTSGPESLDVGTWHELELRMAGERLTAFLDGERLGSVNDHGQRTGNAVLGVSAWDNAQFDDVTVRPVGPRPRFVPRDGLSATATTEHGFDRGWTYGAEHAVDDRPETVWSSRFGPSPGLPQSVTVDLGSVQQVQGLTYQPRLDGNTSGMVTDHRISVSRDGTSFTDVAEGVWDLSSSTKVAAWDRVPARYVRLEATADGACSATATAAEIGVVSGAGPAVTPTPSLERSPCLPPPEMDHTVPQEEMGAEASSVHGPNYTPDRAIDGDETTMWHSAPGAQDPLPATVTLDLGREYRTQALGYLPRQDGNQNGHVTAYEVQVRSAAGEFVTVAEGRWPGNGTVQHATWEPTTARYVRLVATDGTAGVAAAAELNVGHAP
ncbi:discoidin domain-containing protein [Georgenia alba]|uniref:galactosylceramidase n=1 Tax=Georgenia alba TaxID=2233858 RepID=A0ABW2QFV4_9MICO